MAGVEVLIDSDEIPQQTPLIEALHAVLPEPVRDPKRRENDATGRIQYEIIGSEFSQTHRYDPFFDGDTFYPDKNSGGPDGRAWPGMNLYAERALADTAEKLVGSLEGKTVVHFRPEFYPFFAVHAAKKGARSILVDTRAIAQVKELINGERTYSKEQSRSAEQKLREAHGRKDFESAEEQMFWTLPSSEKIAIFVRQHLKIDERLWSSLTPAERSHYIFKFIDDGGILLTRHLSEYYGGKGYNNLEDNVVYFDLPQSQRFPYTLSYLEENLDEELRENISYTISWLVNEKVQDKLSQDELFSMAFDQVYSKLLPTQFWNKYFSGEKVPEAETQREILNSMLQSTSKKDHAKIKKNLVYEYGHGLGDSDIPDGSVDVLFSGWGLDYMENSVDFATNAARILKEEGIFIGYVKTDSGLGSNAKRNIATPEPLREALEKCGFSETVIVFQKGYENGSTSFEDIGMLFFAKKSKQENKNTDLITTDGLPNSFLVETPTHERTSVPALERRKIERTWNEDLTIKDVVSILKENPEDLALITAVVYETPITPTSDLDIENIVRGIGIKFEDLNSILGNINGVSPEIFEKLKDYFGKQEQVNFLLKDFSEAFIKINTFEDTTEIENTISIRSEVLGNSQILEHFQRIREVLLSSSLSPEIQELLNKAQANVYEAMDNDPNHSHVYIENLKSNEIYYSSLDRRIKLKETEELLAAYFLNFDYSFHIDLDDKSTIEASIGRIHKIAQYDYFGDQHLVYFVDQSISLASEEINGLNVRNIDSSDRKVVYLDQISESLETFMGILVYVRDEMPILVLQEWDNITYLEDYDENKKRKDEKLKELTNDIVQQISIHEIQHSYNTGELGSFLAELAFGDTPYYGLYVTIGQLYELADEKSGFDSMMRELGRIHESEHLKAAIEILPAYLDAAVRSGKLSKTLSEKISTAYTKNEAGHLSLHKNNAVKISKDLMKAVSYLTREEIQVIAIDQLREKFGITTESMPRELTSNIPLLNYKDLNSASLPTQIEFDNIEDFSLSIQRAIRLALGSESNLERSKKLSSLSIAVSSQSVDEAVRLARNIPQKFQKQKAFIEIARTALASGDKIKALEILNETEQIFEEGKSYIGEDYPIYEALGNRFFFYRELTEIMQGLEMKHDAFVFLTKVERALIDSSDPTDVHISTFDTLIDIASRKAKLGYKEDALELLSTLSDFVNLNSAKYFPDEAASTGIFLARIEINGDKQNGKSIAAKLPKTMEIGQHFSEANYARAVEVLANLDCREELLLEYVRLKNVSEKINFNNFAILADALYRVGEKEKARELRKLAFENKVKESEEHTRPDDWGFQFQTLKLIKHDELLDEAVAVAMQISDFSNRSKYLQDIGKRFLEIGETEKGIVVLQKAKEYEDDKSNISNIDILIGAVEKN